MPAVLFVCLGNICRSPMAEAICAQLLAQRSAAHQVHQQWQVDSAGTSAWHIGKTPDPRTLACCQQHQTPIDSQARQISNRDFLRFDFVLAMDEVNLRNLKKLKQSDKTHIGLLGDYDPHGVSEVPDPYYGEDDGFELIYQQILRACNGFLDQHAH